MIRVFLIQMLRIITDGSYSINYNNFLKLNFSSLNSNNVAKSHAYIHCFVHNSSSHPQNMAVGMLTTCAQRCTCNKNTRVLFAVVSMANRACK